MADQPIPKALMATLWEQVLVGLVVPEASDGCSVGRRGGRGRVKKIVSIELPTEWDLSVKICLHP